MVIFSFTQKSWFLVDVTKKLNQFNLQLQEGSTLVIMHLCAGVILLLVPCVVLSVDRQKVFGNLHESVSLPCTVPCSGELTWTRFQKQDDVLVRCSSVSCRSKDGFILSYEQYLKGNSSLTMLKADYRLRGLYMAKCVSETVCEVVFTLSPQEFSHSYEPGEPIDVYLPLTDLVEVSFTPSDAVQPSNLQICTVENEKIQCSPDYKERASRLNILQVKDGNVSDSGNYTVRDLVNNETIAIVTAEMRGERVSQTRSRGRRSAPEPCPHIKQQEGVPVWVVVLMVLLLVAVLVVVSVMHVRLRRENQQLRQKAENNGLPLQQNGNGNHPGEERNFKEPLVQVQSV